MEKLTEEDIKNLDNAKLIKRMDEIIQSDSLDMRELQILELNISSIMDTKKVSALEENFKRKIAYASFGMILQIKYNNLSLAPHPYYPGDQQIIKQISWAERTQWMIISSRIILEYFMSIIYMIETGKVLNGTKVITESGEKIYSKFETVKRWLKKPDNKFNYFAISIARAKRYSSLKRDPEIHASTKIAKKVLTLSADELDDSILDLIKIIKNQWPSVIRLANNERVNGYQIIEDEFNDGEWYDLINSGDQEKIISKIDEMMPNTN